MGNSVGVSVVIPVYNAEKYICRCIDSVVAQTYRNLEIILVDDGSTDDSALLCREYARRDARITYMRQENAGLGAARNTGIKASAFDYITFLDADDWLEQSFVEKTVEAMADSGSDIGLCDIYYVDSLDMSKVPVKIRFRRPVVSVASDVSVINKSRLFAWGKIYKKALFTHHGIEYPSIAYEDIITPMVVSLAGRVAYVPEALINYYRNRQGSLSNDPGNIDDIGKGLSLLGNGFKKLGQYDRYLLEYKKIALGQLRFACRKWGPGNSKEIADSLKKLEDSIGTVFPELRNITRKKFYTAEDLLAGALDKSLPYAAQRVENVAAADYLVAFSGSAFATPGPLKVIAIPRAEGERTAFEFNTAELIMERI